MVVAADARQHRLAGEEVAELGERAEGEGDVRLAPEPSASQKPCSTRTVTVLEPQVGADGARLVPGDELDDGVDVPEAPAVAGSSSSMTLTHGNAARRNRRARRNSRVRACGSSLGAGPAGATAA